MLRVIAHGVVGIGIFAQHSEVMVLLNATYGCRRLWSADCRTALGTC